MSEDLTLREKKILKVLINEYIFTAQPVSSKVIAEKFGLSISSATVRNSMKELEEKGLLKQPHHSSGRIPTDKGYRVYVDKLVKPEKLSSQERERIKKNITAEYAAVEDLLSQTSRVLGRISNLLGVTIAPHLDWEILTHIDLLPAAERKLLVVIAVKSGIVKSFLLDLDSEIRAEALQETERVLNQRLSGLSLKEVMSSAERKLSDCYTANSEIIKLFLDFTDNLLSFQEEEKVYLGESNNLLAQPEFKNWERVSNFVRLIEDKKFWLKIISTKVIQEGISVSIGRELEKEEIQACSLICCSYGKGSLKGKLGLIGPTRMRYARLVSLVDYTSLLLGEMLSQ
jgi:heat-inducible transcriptional repressor